MAAGGEGARRQRGGGGPGRRATGRGRPAAAPARGSCVRPPGPGAFRSRAWELAPPRAWAEVEPGQGLLRRGNAPARAAPRPGRGRAVRRDAAHAAPGSGPFATGPPPAAAPPAAPGPRRHGAEADLRAAPSQVVPPEPDPALDPCGAVAAHPPSDHSTALRARPHRRPWRSRGRMPRPGGRASTKRAGAGPGCPPVRGGVDPWWPARTCRPRSRRRGCSDSPRHPPREPRACRGGSTRSDWCAAAPARTPSAADAVAL